MEMQWGAKPSLVPALMLLMHKWEEKTPHSESRKERKVAL